MSLLSVNVHQTMTSVEIAALLAARHSDVVRSLERLRDRGVITLPSPVSYGEVSRLYRLEERETYIVVAQMSPEFTAALVDRWKELETQLVTQLSADQEPYFSYADWKRATKHTGKITYKDECNMRVFPDKLQRMGGSRNWVKMVSGMLYMNDAATLILTAILAPKSVSGLYMAGPDEHLGKCMKLAQSHQGLLT